MLSLNSCAGCGTLIICEFVRTRTHQQRQQHRLSNRKTKNARREQGRHLRRCGVLDGAQPNQRQQLIGRQIQLSLQRRVAIYRRRNAHVDACKQNKKQNEFRSARCLRFTFSIERCQRRISFGLFAQQKRLKISASLAARERAREKRRATYCCSGVCFNDNDIGVLNGGSDLRRRRDLRLHLLGGDARDHRSRLLRRQQRLLKRRRQVKVQLQASRARSVQFVTNTTRTAAKRRTN